MEAIRTAASLHVGAAVVPSMCCTTGCWRCGTHGKTTTSGMRAHIVDHAGLEPGFLTARAGRLRCRRGTATAFFVIEAE
jgi:UDP-N-acetylmuramate-alanine ligase